MKRFLEGVLQWKTWVCFMFTGSTLLYIAIALCMGERTVEIMSLISLVVISAAGTLLQYVAFTGAVIKKLRYSLRLLVFAVPFLGVLVGCAKLFNWLPKGVPGWLSFCGIYLLVFCAITAGFEIYYRVTGRRYDGLLGQYKRAREKAQDGE